MEEIKDYIDPRIKNIFGSDYNSSAEEARPTSTVVFNDRTNYCSYCGRQALPIQAGLKDKNRYSKPKLTSEDYKTTGYWCVCKGAIDELEVLDLIGIEKKKMQQALDKIKKDSDKVIKEWISKFDEENPEEGLSIVLNKIVGKHAGRDMVKVIKKIDVNSKIKGKITDETMWMSSCLK